MLLHFRFHYDTMSLFTVVVECSARDWVLKYSFCIPIFYFYFKFAYSVIHFLSQFMFHIWKIYHFTKQRNYTKTDIRFKKFECDHYWLMCKRGNFRFYKLSTFGSSTNQPYRNNNTWSNHIAYLLFARYFNYWNILIIPYVYKHERQRSGKSRFNQNNDILV